MKFFWRTAAGSIPISWASLSIMRSTRCVASGRPAPRYGSVGMRLVGTPTVRAAMPPGHLYEPPDNKHATAWNAPNVPT